MPDDPFQTFPGYGYRPGEQSVGPTGPTGPVQPAPDTAPTKTPWWKGKWAYLGVGFLVGLTMGSCSGGNDTSTATPGPEVTVTAPAAPVTVTAPAPAPAADPAPAEAAPAPAPAEVKTAFGDGMWLVGSDADIKPGTYKLAKATGPVCYWERLTDTSGDFSAIAANELVATGSQSVVTISASDAAFKSDGCGEWTKVG